MANTQNGFIVLLVLMGSYQPTFHDDEKLMFFETEAEAQAEIQDCINEVAAAVLNGYMDNLYELDDYKVNPATLTGTTIRCTVDGDNFEMDLTDDDYTQVS